MACAGACPCSCSRCADRAPGAGAGAEQAHPQVPYCCRGCRLGHDRQLYLLCVCRSTATRANPRISVWVHAEHEVEMAGTSGTSPAEPPFRVTFLPASAPEANGTAKPGKRKRQADGAAPQASVYCSGRQTCMKAVSMLLCILAGASTPRSCSTHSCCQWTELGQTLSSEASMSCRPRHSTAAALL